MKHVYLKYLGDSHVHTFCLGCFWIVRTSSLDAPFVVSTHGLFVRSLFRRGDTVFLFGIPAFHLSAHLSVACPSLQPIKSQSMFGRVRVYVRLNNRISRENSNRAVRKMTK